MTTTANEHQQIAQTIIQQINAAGPAFPKLTGMMGAKDFVYLRDKSIIDGEYIRGGLMFRVEYMHGTVRGVKVIIELTAMDDYTVIIGRTRGHKWTELKRHEGIYFDELGVTIAQDLGIG